MSQLGSTDFEWLADFLFKQAGMALSADKAYLLDSRLTPIVRRRGLSNLGTLITELQVRPTEALKTEVIEAMMTHESFFFRDVRAFEALEKQIMERLRPNRAKTRKLRIWCAAASTGQEPYTIAMLLSEQAHLWRDWAIEIVATDISMPALLRAKAGIYSQFEVQRGLSIHLLMKHFTQGDAGWEASSKLRSMVKFQQFNLLDNPAAFGVFDLILCRNVCIYFDTPTKSKVLHSLSGQLADDGLLLLGASETILGTQAPLRNTGLFPGILERAAATQKLARAG
jgi:chemotaxis protein methyltransferase CheR